MKKLSIALTIIVLILLLAVSCRHESEDNGPQITERRSQENSANFKVTDSTETVFLPSKGDSIEVTDPIDPWLPPKK